MAQRPTRFFSRLARGLIIPLMLAGCTTMESGRPPLAPLAQQDTRIHPGAQPGPQSGAQLSAATIPDNGARTYRELFGPVRDAMLALDPRYASFLRDTRFVFHEDASESLNPGALAYFNDPHTNPISGRYVGINDFAEKHARIDAVIDFMRARLPADQVPSATQLMAVEMMAVLANEYAHSEQNNSGAFAALAQARRTGQTQDVCALYARMAHVSDLMSMDMMGRLYMDAERGGNAKITFAVIQTLDMFWDGFNANIRTWRDAVHRDDQKTMQTLFTRMAHDRVAVNGPAGCTIPGELPWVTWTLWPNLRAQADAPLRPSVGF